MAWVERFTCDVCGKLMGEAESWWVADNECEGSTATGEDPVHPVLNFAHPALKLMPWDNLLGHSAGKKHLCGAGCAHTFLDRWMAGFHSGTDNCSGGTPAS